MTKTIKIGTRGSLLAVRQAEFIKASIEAANPGTVCELVKIKTTGDHILDTPLSKIGDKGLFTKEIEARLLDGEISLAVHSMKDMPTKLPEGLKLAAVPERHSPLDAFIAKNGLLFNDLQPGSRVATGSLRRKAQLLAMNPGLIIEEIRGNIVSRLEKLRASQALDGIILAKAGIDRAGFETPVQYEVLTPEIMIPAVGQGALAVEIRVDDLETAALIAPMNCPVTERAVLCEREFLRTLEGGCQVPIAGHAVIENGTITLTGMVASLDGRTMLKDIIVLPENDFVKAGRVLAEKLLAAGADKILDIIYSGTMEK